MVIQMKGKQKRTEKKRDHAFRLFVFLAEEKLVLFKERKQELVQIYQYISIIHPILFL